MVHVHYISVHVCIKVLCILTQLSFAFNTSPSAASPTSIVWWDTMDQRHFCITGSEVHIHLKMHFLNLPPLSHFPFLQVGEITFFNLKTKEVVYYVYVSGCIDVILLASLTDSATYLLVKLKLHVRTCICWGLT